MAMRTLSDRYGVADRRGPGGRMLFRRRRRGGNSRIGRHVVSPCRLALGPERRPRAFTGMEARVWVSPLWLGGLQRSGASLRSRSWLADLSAHASCIQNMAADLSVGKPAGPGCPLFRPAFHAPVLPRVDRLSR